MVKAYLLVVLSFDTVLKLLFIAALVSMSSSPRVVLESYVLQYCSFSHFSSAVFIDLEMNKILAADVILPCLCLFLFGLPCSFCDIRVT